jgi:putative transposase
MAGTVYWWFAKWADDGTLQQLHDALREQVRVQAGRAPTPTAAIIDSRSVRAADTVLKHSRGWDAGKKVNGRKRHLAVDTMGLLLVVLVTATSVQAATPPGPCCGGCVPAITASACAGPMPAMPASWSPGLRSCCA